MTGEVVASLAELEAFGREAESERRTSPPLRGVLAETATTGLVRYEWRHLLPLVSLYIDLAVQDFEAESSVEIGPPRPLPGGETPSMLRQRLKTLLADQFPSETPFTIQRLSELLLEPHKQYSRLDKLAVALEKLLYVTSTLQPAENPPSRPRLKDLPPVNCNPQNPAFSTPQARSFLVHSQTSSQEPQNRSNSSQYTNGSPDPGFGLASAVLASSHESPRSPQGNSGNPELEEALGHLNEAGVAARAAPMSPGRETSSGGSLSPPKQNNLEGQQNSVPDSPEPS